MMAPINLAKHAKVSSRYGKVVLLRQNGDVVYELTSLGWHASYEDRQGVELSAKFLCSDPVIDKSLSKQSADVHEFAKEIIRGCEGEDWNFRYLSAIHAQGWDLYPILPEANTNEFLIAPDPVPDPSGDADPWPPHSAIVPMGWKSE